MVLNCEYILKSFVTPQIFVLISFVFLMVFSAILNRFFVKKHRFILLLAVLLLWIGFLGNSYQRYLTGCVVDNISFFGLFHYNVFDSLVSTGILLSLYVMYKS